MGYFYITLSLTCFGFIGIFAKFALFLVAAAGIFIFREKVGPYGIAGILTGFSHWSCWVSVDLSIVIDISPGVLG
jgi:hypothetical protein